MEAASCREVGPSFAIMNVSRGLNTISIETIAWMQVKKCYSLQVHTSSGAKFGGAALNLVLHDCEFTSVPPSYIRILENHTKRIQISLKGTTFIHTRRWSNYVFIMPGSVSLHGLQSRFEKPATLTLPCLVRIGVIRHELTPKQPASIRALDPAGEKLASSFVSNTPNRVTSLAVCIVTARFGDSNYGEIHIFPLKRERCLPACLQGLEWAWVRFVSRHDFQCHHINVTISSSC